MVRKKCLVHVIDPNTALHAFYLGKLRRALADRSIEIDLQIFTSHEIYRCGNHPPADIYILSDRQGLRTPAEVARLLYHDIPPACRIFVLANGPVELVVRDPVIAGVFFIGFDDGRMIQAVIAALEDLRPAQPALRLAASSLR